MNGSVKKYLSGCFLVLLIAACASDPRNANQMALEDALQFEDRAVERLLRARVELSGLTKRQIYERLNKALLDVTAIVKQTGHGIYVEYTAPDGRLFMWYPGNAGVVVGRWGVSEAFFPPRACFKYFAATHGLTGEFEPNECVPAEQTLGEAYVIDKRRGDVFMLSSNRIPYSKSAGNLPPWPEDYDQVSAE